MSPRGLKPFRRGRVWWARVPRLKGRGAQRSLGVYDETEALEVCRFIEWLRGRGARSAYLLDHLAAGTTEVLDAYRAYVENRLDAFEQTLRAGIADPDLEPYVAKWQREMERQRKPNAQTIAKYVNQVRTLLVEGQPFPRSKFTKHTIRGWLGDLDVGQPNRHRAALSSFARYLVFEDVLESNPVRLVPMAAERAPRSLYLTPQDAARLVGAMPDEYAALHALMIATGMEVSAALKVRRRDIAPPNVFARGTKRAHRERTCTIYGPWLELWAFYVEPWLEANPTLPDAFVFAGLTYRQARAELLAAVSALQLAPDYRIHDHRHTWAVQAVRDGLALHTVANQLGHRDATMILKVYGRYVPTAADFTRSTTESATPPKSKAPKTARLKRA